MNKSYELKDDPSIVVESSPLITLMNSACPDEDSYWDQWMSLVAKRNPSKNLPEIRKIGTGDVQHQERKSYKGRFKNILKDNPSGSSKFSDLSKKGSISLATLQIETTDNIQRDQMRKILLKKPIFQTHPLMTGELPWNDDGFRCDDDKISAAFTIIKEDAAFSYSEDNRTAFSADLRKYFGVEAKNDFYEHFKQISSQRASFNSLEELQKMKFLQLEDLKNLEHTNREFQCPPEKKECSEKQCSEEMPLTLEYSTESTFQTELASGNVKNSKKKFHFNLPSKSTSNIAYPLKIFGSQNSQQNIAFLNYSFDNKEDDSLRLRALGQSELDVNDHEESEDGNQSRTHPSEEGGQVSARTRFLFCCVNSSLAPRANLILRKLHTTQIMLAHQGIGDELGCIFADCLKDLPIVQHLDVTDNRLTDKSLVPLLNALESKTDLMTLNLSENKMDRDGSEALRSYLGKPDSSVISLVLSKSDIDDGECCKLLEALSKNQKLTSLDLSHNNIGKNETMNVVQPDIITGGERIAESLSYITCRLKFLDLSWNSIRLESAVAIGEALGQNYSLTELNIAYNAFGKEGGEAVGKSLFNNTTLKTLDMSHNNITPRAAFVIAVALRGNTTLQHINLEGNPLGEYGGKAFMILCCTAHQRIEIGLKKCNFNIRNDDCWFNSDDPVGGARNGEFLLEMSDAYEFAVMQEILRLASCEEGFQISNLVVDICGKKETIELKRQCCKRNSKAAEAATQSDPDAVFDMFDQDGSGLIELKELHCMFDQLNISINSAEIDRLMFYYDKDQSGFIDRDEFLDILNFITQEVNENRRSSHVMVRTSNQNISWKPDPEMRVKVNICFDLIQSNEYTVFTHEQHMNVIFLCKDTDDKAKLIELALGQIKLQTEEAQKLFEALTREYGSKEKAMSVVLPSMAAPQYARLLLTTNITNNSDMRLLRRKMGDSLPVILGSTSGHYKLDLSKTNDRWTFKKIVKINNMEKKFNKQSGRYDTSQHGNWDNFRNVRFNFVKIETFEQSFMISPPHAGLLEFDYVSTTRPPTNAHAISFKRMCSILTGLGLLDQFEMKTLQEMGSLDQVTSHSSIPTFKRNRQFYVQLCREYHDKLPDPEDCRSNYLYPPILGASGEVKPKRQTRRGAVVSLANRKSISRPLEGSSPKKIKLLGNLDRKTSNVRNSINSKKEDVPSEINIVTRMRRSSIKGITNPDLFFNTQLCLIDRYFTSQQIRFLLLIYKGSTAEKRDLLVAAFDRIIDLRNFDTVIEIFCQEDQANITARLGVLNTWNPLKPDGYIEVDIGRREERQVARMLVHLQKVEGNSFFNPTFQWTRKENSTPGWTLPETWMSEETFPHRGILCVERRPGEGKGIHGSTPQVELRIALTQTVVLCEVDPKLLKSFRHLTFNRQHTEIWLQKARIRLDYTKGLPALL